MISSFSWEFLLSDQVGCCRMSNNRLANLVYLSMEIPADHCLFSHIKFSTASFLLCGTHHLICVRKAFQYLFPTPFVNSTDCFGSLSTGFGSGCLIHLGTPREEPTVFCFHHVSLALEAGRTLSWNSSSKMCPSECCAIPV